MGACVYSMLKPTPFLSDLKASLVYHQALTFATIIDGSLPSGQRRRLRRTCPLVFLEAATPDAAVTKGVTAMNVQLTNR